ncbi:MAG: tetratricopeptide repeat protein, partial [Chloroflexi bacterium]|nr:tetratricopeptide repeat protein [Chloroflexota bacterium]
MTGDPRRALEQTLAFLEDTPSSLGCLVYGNGCFAVGRYSDAAAVYQGILTLQPDDLDARFNLGLTHLRLKD